MAEKPAFIIDSNILITPKLNYYPMDLVPAFWASVAEKIEDGTIAILDLVKDEIMALSEKDDLSIWFDKINVKSFVRHNEPDIVGKYSEIMNLLATDEHYDNSKAIRNWSDVADPWIVSAAATRGYTIVTFEKPVQFSGNSRCSRPKIPNIASSFGVRVIDLYQMIRELGISIT